MKVKVYPHETMVNAGVEACVSVTPDKKHGRAYYMGTVMLRDVEFRSDTHAWAVGEIVHEAVEQLPPSKKVLDNMVQVMYHYNIGRFVTLDGTDVTDKSFKAAIFVGRDVYVSKDGI